MGALSTAPGAFLNDATAAIMTISNLDTVWARQEVTIVPYIDRDDLVQATVDKVSHTIGEGIGLVFIVLILFLGSPRSAMVVAVTIPLALVAVFSLLNLTKLPANLLSMGSIHFGVIVDGAIVVTDAILRRCEEKPTEALSEDEVRGVTGQVAKPIFFATLNHHHGLFSVDRPIQAVV